MAYELINEELNIWSCCIADLTMEQVNSFLSQWEKGAKIGTLTVFKEEYEPGNWRLVINRDCEIYDKIARFAPRYLQASEEKRGELYDKFTVHKSMLQVMNNYLKDRENAKIMEILKYQIEAIPDEYFMTYSLSQKLGEKDRFTGIVKAFEYGFIQGKRCERKRRRKNHDRSDQ